MSDPIMMASADTVRVPSHGDSTKFDDKFINLVRHTWGTVVSVRAEIEQVSTTGEHGQSSAEPEPVSGAVDLFLARVGRVCSLHQESELRELNGGNREIVDCSPELLELLELANSARVVSESRYDHRSQAGFDLYGIAKGWAAEQLVTLLTAYGYDRVAVNIGGDIFVSSSTTPWEIGLQHPEVPGKIFHVVSLLRGGLATSGNYERGAHLGWVANSSANVVGPSGALADAFATAAAYCKPDEFGWLPVGYRAIVTPVGSRISYHIG